MALCILLNKWNLFSNKCVSFATNVDLVKLKLVQKNKHCYSWHLCVCVGPTIHKDQFVSFGRAIARLVELSAMEDSFIGLQEATSTVTVNQMEDLRLLNRIDAPRSGRRTITVICIKFGGTPTCCWSAMALWHSRSLVSACVASCLTLGLKYSN